ncbi:30S ribosomal protein S14 [Neorickettsia findlayensis]|uniref:Small ribosomal subunit protein uS14 n=1 Tax=Neorickettsia findlayensis TaxID=2686014 RepID=A0A6P1G9D4_9RICK|nr:30S ribosomal protein S14 [Neorickettsia findlayensis]QHD65057.1 30S ribosomal protein S14 [Neorickettsia findlayensis]
MAKKALVVKDERKKALACRSRERRSTVRNMRNDKSISLKERIAIQAKLNSLPRNSSPVRSKNRCSITGRPRGYYRKFGISRIQLRVLANWGKLPGVVKSSW